MIIHPTWSSASTVATDCTFHQIAPYIGRMKTSIARFLIRRFSNPGDLIADPFCGSGVIALEAAIARRKIVAADWNPYAITLTRAKLLPPNDLRTAENQLHAVWETSRQLIKEQDLRTVPIWVRQFFHPETLRSALAFRDACANSGDSFLLACLLGILHHQRPGFLSYPSSHLVPYLRNRKFPRHLFPNMYSERDVLSRIEAKVRRTFRRPPVPFIQPRSILHADARNFPAVGEISAVITSPPYMNELDYIRDNRLRLWFIGRKVPVGLELAGRKRESAYTNLLQLVCARLAPQIRQYGYFILVVGEAGRGKGRPGNTAEITMGLFGSYEPLKAFRLCGVIHDNIPDIRRSRRDYRGTKRETLLVFQKTPQNTSNFRET